MRTPRSERGMRTSASSCRVSPGARSPSAWLGDVGVITGVGVGVCVGGGGIWDAVGAGSGEGLGATLAAGAGEAVGEGAAVLQAATRTMPPSKRRLGCLQPLWIWFLLRVGSWYIMSLVRRSCDIGGPG